jgi:hypothetical protein
VIQERQLLTAVHDQLIKARIALTGALFFIVLVCAISLAVVTFILLILSFAAWKPYAALGGRLPAQLMNAIKRLDRW